MNEADCRKLLSSMTMCRRAGRLLLGFDPVKEAALQKRVHCVLLASDCAPKTEKEIRYHCSGLPCRKLPFSMEDLTVYFTKRTAVFGVADAGFAASMLRCFGDDACDETKLD